MPAIGRWFVRLCFGAESASAERASIIRMRSLGLCSGCIFYAESAESRRNLSTSVLPDSTNSPTSFAPLSATVDVLHLPPVITLNPVAETVVAGDPVAFTAAATGTPTPTVQWQVSTDGGTTFKNIDGATSTSYHPPTPPSANGNEYRAVFKNVRGTAT